MLIAYRPELENPPREGGFGIIMGGGMIQLAPGLNQEVPDDQWKQARENRMVKRLMAIGAIEEVREQITVEKILWLRPSVPLSLFTTKISLLIGKKWKVGCEYVMPSTNDWTQLNEEPPNHGCY
jgi:hypothetical protein